MIKIAKHLLIVSIIFISYTCRKKTTIDVTVFDYALNEPVADAKVVMVERKESGVFTSNASCNEIASAICDANGNCTFDKEKLRTGSSYKYFIAITESYGKEQTYPCEGKTSGFLDIGSMNKKNIEVGIIPAYFKVQLNNFLIPSQTNDSFFISIKNPKYILPESDTSWGGRGGIF
jgi:hypothetical protein